MQTAQASSLTVNRIPNPRAAAGLRLSDGQSNAADLDRFQNSPESHLGLKRRGLSAQRSIYLLAALWLFFAGCHSHKGLPDASSKQYDQFVSTFYVGLSALQVGNDVLA